MRGVHGRLLAGEMGAGCSSLPPDSDSMPETNRPTPSKPSMSGNVVVTSVVATVVHITHNHLPAPKVERAGAKRSAVLGVSKSATKVGGAKRLAARVEARGGEARPVTKVGGEARPASRIESEKMPVVRLRPSLPSLCAGCGECCAGNGVCCAGNGRCCVVTALRGVIDAANPHPNKPTTNSHPHQPNTTIVSSPATPNSDGVQDNGGDSKGEDGRDEDGRDEDGRGEEREAAEKRLDKAASIAFGVPQRSKTTATRVRPDSKASGVNGSAAAPWTRNYARLHPRTFALRTSPVDERTRLIPEPPIACAKTGQGDRESGSVSAEHLALCSRLVQVLTPQPQTMVSAKPPKLLSASGALVPAVCALANNTGSANNTLRPIPNLSVLPPSNVSAPSRSVSAPDDDSSGLVESELESDMEPGLESGLEAWSDVEADERVVTFVAHTIDCVFCDRIQQKHESGDKSVHPSTFLFQCKSMPQTPIVTYLKRFVRMLRMTRQCLILALIYIARFMRHCPNFPVTILTIHRLLLAACRTASKFYDDRHARNNHWKEQAGVPLEELNQLEMAFATLVDFRFYVSKEHYVKALRSLIVSSPILALHPQWSPQPSLPVRDELIGLQLAECLTDSFPIHWFQKTHNPAAPRSSATSEQQFPDPGKKVWGVLVLAADVSSALYVGAVSDARSGMAGQSCVFLEHGWRVCQKCGVIYWPAFAAGNWHKSTWRTACASTGKHHLPHPYIYSLHFIRKPANPDDGKQSVRAPLPGCLGFRACCNCGVLYWPLTRDRSSTPHSPTPSSPMPICLRTNGPHVPHSDFVYGLADPGRSIINPATTQQQQPRTEPNPAPPPLTKSSIAVETVKIKPSASSVMTTVAVPWSGSGAARLESEAAWDVLAAEHRGESGFSGCSCCGALYWPSYRRSLPFSKDSEKCGLGFHRAISDAPLSLFYHTGPGELDLTPSVATRLWPSPVIRCTTTEQREQMRQAFSTLAVELPAKQILWQGRWRPSLRLDDDPKPKNHDNKISPETHDTHPTTTTSPSPSPGPSSPSVRAPTPRHGESPNPTMSHPVEQHRRANSDDAVARGFATAEPRVTVEPRVTAVLGRPHQAWPLAKWPEQIQPSEEPPGGPPIAELPH